MTKIPDDERRFSEIYKKHRHLMMTVAMNVLEDQHLAEDAVQSAFVSLFKNMGHVGEPDSTATKRYLVTITKNAAIDLYRKREKKMQREIYIDELGGEKVPVTYMETDLDNARFKSRMKRLMHRRRHAFPRRAALLVPFAMAGVAAAALSAQAYKVLLLLLRTGI